MTSLEAPASPPAAPGAFTDGQLIQDTDGKYGTVRYIGTVATSRKNPDAVWIGIEWRDDTRGKHDGAVTVKKTGEVVRYFTCMCCSSPA